MILNIIGEKPPLFYVPTSIVVKLNAFMAMRGRRDALVNRSIPLEMHSTQDDKNVCIEFKTIVY